MNSLKQYSLDGIDMSVYTASQGIPFRANIVGVAYDSQTKTTFYSDVTTFVHTILNILLIFLLYRIYLGYFLPPHSVVKGFRHISVQRRHVCHCVFVFM